MKNEKIVQMSLDEFQAKFPEAHRALLAELEESGRSLTGDFVLFTWNDSSIGYESSDGYDPMFYNDGEWGYADEGNMFV